MFDYTVPEIDRDTRENELFETIRTHTGSFFKFMSLISENSVTL